MIPNDFPIISLMTISLSFFTYTRHNWATLLYLKLIVSCSLISTMQLATWSWINTFCHSNYISHHSLRINKQGKATNLTLACCWRVINEIPPLLISIYALPVYPVFSMGLIRRQWEKCIHKRVMEFTWYNFKWTNSKMTIRIAKIVVLSCNISFWVQLEDSGNIHILHRC